MTIECRTLVGTDTTTLLRTERGSERESSHWEVSMSEVRETYLRID